MAETHYDGPAIQINPASGFAVEMRKWESTYTMYGAPGRPYVYEEYPRAMFKAGHPDGRPGKVVITDYRDAGNDIERTALEASGFRVSQAEAIEAQAAWDLAVAKAAAESAWDDRRMTEKARAERMAVDDSTAQHVAEVPRVHPKKTRAQALTE